MLSPTLEKISTNQLNFINQLWLMKAEIAIHKCSNPEVKKRRREQLQELKKHDNITENRTIEELTQLWWDEEVKWLSTFTDPANTEPMLCYRYLIIFYKNLTQCPFTETSKPMIGKEKTVADSKDYEAAAQDVFDESFQTSLSYLSGTQDVHLKRALPYIQKFQALNLDRNLYSARHKLMDKDIGILKGLAVGGVSRPTASRRQAPPQNATCPIKA